MCRLPTGKEPLAVQTYALLELVIGSTSTAHERVGGMVKSIAASLDLTFRVGQDSRQFILGACSEKALNGALAVLRDSIGDEVRTEGVQLAYRESVKVSADVDYTHKKQSGGVGEFGRVLMQVTPSPYGIQFRNDCVNGNVLSEYVDAVEKGAREAAETGGLLGMPVTAVEIRLKDGAYHDLDSSPAAFEEAARCAFVEAIRRSGGRLMEPLATIAVLAREQHVATVASELERRNASVAKLEVGAMCVIVASSRMFDLLGFEAELDSISAGDARTAFILSGYAEVPSNEVPPDATPAVAVLPA